MEKKLPDEICHSKEVAVELDNPMDDTAALEQEELGHSLNMMSSLYYEYPSGESDELIIEREPCGEEEGDE